MRTIYPASAQVHLLFPTPMLVLEHPAAQTLNAELAGYIQACAAREPSHGKSVRYGWHSQVDFLDRDQRPVRTLRGWIEDAIAEITRFSLGEKAPAYVPHIVASWANVLADRGYHKFHAHRNNAWAGVYYVRVPAATGEADAGSIEFPDPRGGAATFTPERFGLMLAPVSIRPSEGTLLVFPAWLPHFVNPHHGPSPRIAISFNATLRPGTAAGQRAPAPGTEASR